MVVFDFVVEIDAVLGADPNLIGLVIRDNLLDHIAQGEIYNIDFADGIPPGRHFANARGAGTDPQLAFSIFRNGGNLIGGESVRRREAPGKGKLNQAREGKLISKIFCPLAGHFKEALVGSKPEIAEPIFKYGIDNIVGDRCLGRCRFRF